MDMLKPGALNANHVLACYFNLVVDVILLRTDPSGASSTQDISNIPICQYSMCHGSNRRLMFRTTRNNETVGIEIIPRKIELRFYDEIGKRFSSKEYCLEIKILKELANPEKFQQEFSAFLATEKHIGDFISETIWPHIDETVKKAEEKAQRKIERLNRFNRKTIPREQNTRYSFRVRKKDEEVDRRETRSMRNSKNKR